MRDVSSDTGDVVKITNYNSRSEDHDLKHSKEAQNGNLQATDLETAITAAGFGTYHWLALLIAIPASFTSSMCTGSNSMVLPAIGCEFQCSNSEKGILQVAPYFGMIVSGFFWGSASDSLGRRKLIVYGFILDAIVGVLAALAPTLLWMIILKTVSGALSCGPNSIFITFLSESLSDKYRRYAVLSVGLFTAIGIMLQPALALLITVYVPFEPVIIFGGYKFTSWRLFLVLVNIPSLLSALGSAFLFESPKFLFQNGQSEEALRVCREIYKWNTGRPGSTFPVQKLIDPKMKATSNANEGQPKKNFLRRALSGLALSMALFKRPYVGRASMICAIQFGALAAMNSLRLWLPQIFALVDTADSINATSSNRLCGILENSTRSSGSLDCEINSPTSFINMIIVNSFMLVAQVLFIGSVKYLGKKVPVVTSTLIPALFAAAMTFVDVKYVVYLTAVYVSTLNVAFFTIALLVTETFPTSLRATSLNTTQICGRVGVLLSVSFVSVFMFTHCYIILPGLSVVLFTISLIAMLLPMSPITPPVEST